MPKLVRVNMTSRQVTEQPTPKDLIHLGGRALTSAIVSSEVPADCDPLGPNNKLIFAPGILGGLTVSSFGRISVGTKSPLTGGIKEANAGGTTGSYLGRLGVKALVLEGAPDSGLYVIHMSKDGVTVHEAPELKMMGTYECAKVLDEKFGKKTAKAIIGPAGELLLRASGIGHTDPEGLPARYSGRGGVGAVMGSKGVKAIVIDASGVSEPEVKDKESYREARSTVAKMFVESPAVQEGYKKFGTANLVDTVNALGAMPTKNFLLGSFDKASNINGKTLRETILQRGGEGKTHHACMPGCIIQCSNVYADEHGKIIVGPVEYETIVLCGSNCCIDNLDDIARINYACNDLGLDTIDVGGALGVAMEAGVVSFGDAQRSLEILEEVRTGGVFGRLIGSGTQVTASVLGVKRVPTVKGQCMAAYDPRGIKGLGVTYASSPMGADHTAGQTVRAPLPPKQAEGQVETSRKAQVTAAMMDSVGMCMFAGTGLGGKFDLVAQVASALWGEPVSVDDLMNMGQDTLRREIDFNRRAGLSKAHDRLPEVFRTERNPNSESVFDVSQDEIDSMIEHNVKS